MSEIIVGYRHCTPQLNVSEDGCTGVLDCEGIYYREVNEAVRAALGQGIQTLTLTGINGQRYIGDGLTQHGASLIIEGTAGQDLAMFMAGPSIEVLGNAQDGVGNTMDAGTVIVHGNAGDVVGYGMRGGTVLIKGDVGYRVGIHMKEYKTHRPLIIAGGCARDFFGEYMAGGELLLLGLDAQGELLDGPLTGEFTGTGMHGGVMYIRGEISPALCGKEVGVFDATEEERAGIKHHLQAWCAAFAAELGKDESALLDELLGCGWSKLIPVSSRPYGNLYTSF